MGNAVRIAELSVHFKIADHTAVLRVKRNQLQGKLRIKIIGVAGRYRCSNDPEFFQKRGFSLPLSRHFLPQADFPINYAIFLTTLR